MGGTGATGTLNLSGDAVFSTGFIHAGWDALGDATATMKINFDGGTLKVNPNSLYVGGKDYKVDDVVVESAVFVDSRLSTTSDIAILSGGATVDTSGANVSINTAIVEDPLSTGGNFTKIGDGMLTLTGSVGYTGDTIVNVGGLTVNAGLNTPTATVYVATGTTLNAPSIVADTLVIGGGPYVAATAAAVPEPSTFVLLALAGMVALFAARRRK
jgi:autotransporter-associated beta strand protein